MLPGIVLTPNTLSDMKSSSGRRCSDASGSCFRLYCRASSSPSCPSILTSTCSPRMLSILAGLLASSAQSSVYFSWSGRISLLALRSWFCRRTSTMSPMKVQAAASIGGYMSRYLPSLYTPMLMVRDSPNCTTPEAIIAHMNFLWKKKTPSATMRLAGRNAHQIVASYPWCWYVMAVTSTVMHPHSDMTCTTWWAYRSFANIPHSPTPSSPAAMIMCHSTHAAAHGHTCNRLKLFCPPRLGVVACVPSSCRHSPTGVSRERPLPTSAHSAPSESGSSLVPCREKRIGSRAGSPSVVQKDHPCTGIGSGIRRNIWLPFTDSPGKGTGPKLRSWYAKIESPDPLSDTQPSFPCIANPATCGARMSPPSVPLRSSSGVNLNVVNDCTSCAPRATTIPRMT
mmetsp:Transcript_1317/g.3133  ORF Transcript_1317/g.3133 Transcript_1317/m.3133 type:complete len:397 (+) Transcript_1317:617-1807(+)